MATGTIVKQTNQYNTETYTTSTFTPLHDGWAVASGSVTSTQTIQPIIRISHSTDILAEGIGLLVESFIHCGCPVYAGVTYTIDAYRCSFTDVKIFY